MKMIGGWWQSTMWSLGHSERESVGGGCASYYAKHEAEI